jgi:RNA polymerase sigma-70 factor (sigma-E family)
VREHDDAGNLQPLTTDSTFTVFCGRVRPRLVGALALHCGDRGTAEELAQEALARVWERWTQVQQMQNPSAWTYRVAFNLATSWFRRRAAETRARERSVPVSPPMPDHAQAVAVRQAVAALPPRRRAALVLRYYLDLSVADTAEVMGCSQGAVKALCAQAATTLRAHPLLTEVEDTIHG